MRDHVLQLYRCMCLGLPAKHNTDFKGVCYWDSVPVAQREHPMLNLPTGGILVCGSKNERTVRHALNGSSQPLTGRYQSPRTIFQSLSDPEFS